MMYNSTLNLFILKEEEKMLLIETETGELVENDNLPTWLHAALANLAVAIKMAAAPQVTHVTQWGTKPGAEAAASVAAFATAIAAELKWYGLKLNLKYLAAEAQSVQMAAEQLM